ncbi:MAG TPA: group III truncated hemoglobin [Niabella sp.]|nr:group III truncated hemoglobin [Niabella sp.]HQW15872.1 group III truncated hemoglobin [Niabella sp.]HQX21084.1 group III truncated hemoglobin [Niabella sp.]HQX40905.1 group III truncated hemoglobin [Niabella sp.]HRB36913.1 group III truncated hemoglobin [Niabella sp.]
MDKKDITTIEDIKVLVNNFYGKVRRNELLGPIFEGIIKDNWPVHLEKMYRFWQTVLLDDHTYFGTPFPPHAKMPIAQEHFTNWLALWHETINDHFQGRVADEAKWRGDKMATMFLSKLEYYRDNSSAISLV